MTNTKYLVSIAVPVFNEQENIPELVRRLLELQTELEALDGGAYQLEFVFINDGSTDNSGALLNESARGNKAFQVVNLSRNFGHQSALTAALDLCRGEAVILMDADLQDPPSLIKQMLEQHRQGADVVYTYRVSRAETWYLRLCYYLYYRILNLFSSVKIAQDSGDFALLSRRVVQVIKQMPESHRFIRGLRAWTGFKQVGLPIERPARFAGKSKYGVVKLLALAFDGIVSFSTSPLRIATIAGFAGIVFSFCYTLYAVWVKLALGISPNGFTALLAIVVFLASAQFLFLGILGEYVGRIYEQSKQRPHYIVSDIVRGGAPASDAPGKPS